MKPLFLLLVIFFPGCATHATKYAGVTRRASDGQPVSDIFVAASATPIPRSYLIFPRHDINVGLTRSSADGTYAFVLPYPSCRLSFSALGAPIEYPGGAVCGNVMVKHPSPDRPIVITIPDTFRPIQDSANEDR